MLLSRISGFFQKLMPHIPVVHVLCCVARMHCIFPIKLGVSGVEDARVCKLNVVPKLWENECNAQSPEVSGSLLHSLPALLG